MNKVSSTWLSLASVALFTVVAELLAAAEFNRAGLIPSPYHVLRRVLELGLTAEFWVNSVGYSLMRLISAALLFVLPAITLAIAAGLNPSTRAVLQPFVNFTLPLPKVALYPVILAFLGIGNAGKIVLIGIGMFYPVFINVTYGVLQLRASGYLDVAKVYRIESVRLWIDFYARGLVPSLVTGLKTAVGYGFTLVVVSEMSASQNGLGHFIWRSWDSFQILDMYSGIFWLCFLGWIVQAAMSAALERRLAA